MELNFYLIILPLVPLNQLITLPTHGNLKIPLPTQTILPPPPAIRQVKVAKKDSKAQTIQKIISYAFFYFLLLLSFGYITFYG